LKRIEINQYYHDEILPLIQTLAKETHNISDKSFYVKDIASADHRLKKRDTKSLFGIESHAGILRLFLRTLEFYVAGDHKLTIKDFRPAKKHDTADAKCYLVCTTEEFYAPKDFKYVYPFFNSREQWKFNSQYKGFITEYAQEGYYEDPRYNKRTRKDKDPKRRNHSDISTTPTQDVSRSTQSDHFLSEITENVDDIPEVASKLEKLDTVNIPPQTNEKLSVSENENTIPDSLMFPPNAVDTPPTETDMTPTPAHYSMVETDQGSASPPDLMHKNRTKDGKSDTSRDLLRADNTIPSLKKSCDEDTQASTKLCMDHLLHFSSMIYDTNMSLLNHDLLSVMHNIDEVLLDAYKDFTTEFHNFYSGYDTGNADILEMSKAEISAILEEEHNMRYQFNRYHKELIRFDSRYNGNDKASINMDLFSRRTIKLIRINYDESTPTDTSKIKNISTSSTQKLKRMCIPKPSHDACKTIIHSITDDTTSTNVRPGTPVVGLIKKIPPKQSSSNPKRSVILDNMPQNNINQKMLVPVLKSNKRKASPKMDQDVLKPDQPSYEDHLDMTFNTDIESISSRIIRKHKQDI
jgi:hypothetical protein